MTDGFSIVSSGFKIYADYIYNKDTGPKTKTKTYLHFIKRLKIYLRQAWKSHMDRDGNDVTKITDFKKLAVNLGLPDVRGARGGLYCGSSP